MSFANQVRAASSRLIAEVKQKHHAVALELFTKIQQKTPVDTGEARRLWTFQAIPDGYLISTPIPYMPALEYGLYPNPPKAGKGKTVNGFSRQAPQGFVRLSIKEVANKWK